MGELNEEEGIRRAQWKVKLASPPSKNRELYKNDLFSALPITRIEVDLGRSLHPTLTPLGFKRIQEYHCFANCSNCGTS